MPSYILRDIDPREWAQFKKAAATAGHPLRFLFMQYVRAYPKAPDMLNLILAETPKGKNQ